LAIGQPFAEMIAFSYAVVKQDAKTISVGGYMSAMFVPNPMADFKSFTLIEDGSDLTIGTCALDGYYLWCTV